ncbi:hypothetical protein RRF57_004196 [Xylaria bambusicola]|uniref:Uncharacterized protein n=1 Tax=Xylaria bambusicola TaxID=326684 RepID=A0AAN7UND5_9PEZI
MKGNFGVMHMDVASHRASEGRDAAAKRTSEGTLLQAKLAQTDGYVSHQRRANYPRPPGLKQFNSPKRSAEPVVEPGPPQPLTVAETKAEQARLLTLLRTLPHYTVVDQICRGLAFFGGVPDAPPPADGKFPESALANGSGSLFVGWIAEIFPDLENPRPKYVEDAAAQSSNQKRPRGRPKGSKARKTRSDKGVKKGPQKANKGAEDPAQDPQDDSWVDVEDSVLELNDDGDLVEAMTALRNAPSTPSTAPNGGGMVTATAAKSSAAGFRSINDNSLTPGSSTKKRGRPKGSKNRPKDKSVLQSIPPPKVTPVPVPVPMLDAHPKPKTSSAKSKSTKNRPKPTDVPSDTATTHATQQHAEPSITEPSSSAQARTSAPDFADRSGAPTVNGSNTHTEEGHQPVQTTKPTLPSPASQVKASTVTAKKRKRPTGNAASQVESIPPPGGVSSNSQHVQSNANVVASSAQLQDQASQHVRQATPSSVGIPQAKRARKSQESSSTATVRRQTPNNLGQKASNPPVSSHAEPAQQPNSEDGAQTQPQAEGLEAHYAAMQSHTDQIQSYNSRPQHKQQPQSTSSMGSTVSPTPATAAVPTASGGLDAHYDHFAALQSLSDNSRQTNTVRQKQQQQAQTASPIATQSSKLPQMSAALTSQQQSRTSQNYYSQGQGYNSQQQSYSTTQRSQQHISNTSSNTGLQHVTNSPQFSTQSNSPLMQTDSNYRGSPSLMHNNASFATRRPPSASPMDNSPAYRSSSATNHGVANHSPHFSARQTSTTSTGHSASHSGLSSAFPTFSDSSLFDMALDSGGSHSNMGMGNSSYTLNNGAVSQQQRSSSANSAPLYSSTGMNNTYLGSTNMGRAGQQNRWAS